MNADKQVCNNMKSRGTLVVLLVVVVAFAEGKFQARLQ